MRAGYMLNNSLDKKHKQKDVRQDKEKNIESKAGWFNLIYFKTVLI